MTETVCAGNSRERKVFTSASNRLEVRLVTGSEQSERRNSHFLLRFEGITIGISDILILYIVFRYMICLFDHA